MLRGASSTVTWAGLMCTPCTWALGVWPGSTTFTVGPLRRGALRPERKLCRRLRPSLKEFRMLRGAP
eukprot:6491405-Alexandrium_andersonii.AAC.1